VELQPREIAECAKKIREFVVVEIGFPRWISLEKIVVHESKSGGSKPSVGMPGAFCSGEGGPARADPEYKRAV
jgi:hypothetical protein